MDERLGRRAIHMVSAWASENRLVLAQQKVNEKSNEITAIPALLAMLEMAGCIVTIDAMGCQKEIAQRIQNLGNRARGEVGERRRSRQKDISWLDGRFLAWVCCCLLDTIAG